MLKRLAIVLLVFVVMVGAGAGLALMKIAEGLPQMITIADYKPLLVTKVFDRKGRKIGEFFRERRVLTPYEEVPKIVVQAFLAAEDDQFFQHRGINFAAIARAAIANFRAGQTVQGASTITQQVAKTLFLTPEQNILRKVKEAILAFRMEERLTKEEILYLYLNQINFGAGAHGIGMAAEIYFRKPVRELTLAEAAILASLPKAPSRLSPIRNPEGAKERQLYVLRRMVETKMITETEANEAAKLPLKVFTRENFDEYGPFYLETVRQLLTAQLGGEMVLERGLRVTTGMDLDAQIAAQNAMRENLKDLDKRQGFRGPLRNTVEPREVGEFLLKTRNQLIADKSPERVIQPDGTFVDYGPLNLQYKLKDSGLPSYLGVGKTTEAIVSRVDDELGVVFLHLAEVRGVIDFESMRWARKPNPEKRFDLDRIEKPSQALKMGDVVLVRITGEKFQPSDRLRKLVSKKLKPSVPPRKVKGKPVPAPEAPTWQEPEWSNHLALELDQEPIAEGSLISFDLQSSDLVAMVGGLNFARSEYNRALQAARQTGSSFKALVYAAALDKGFHPASPLIDAPLVFEEGAKEKESEEGQGDVKIWRPENFGKSFGGDVILRNALVKSLNVPSVKIIESIGVPYSIDYSRRLGLFSPLNNDFTLVLGSSSVTLYEMTKSFAHFARLGKRISPVLIRKIEDSNGNEISGPIATDQRFAKEYEAVNAEFETRRTEYLAKVQAGEVLDPANHIEPHIFFEDPEQLISPQTAYLMTSILKGVVEDPGGTAGRARALGREVAGKTGSTNRYYDAWFIGYTSQFATGTWVGFDQERSLGVGEVGGRASLPAWVEYMKSVSEGLPPVNFPVPEGITFVNMDPETGRLASAASKNVVRQAFREGTQPTQNRDKREEDTEFLRQELQE